MSGMGTLMIILDTHVWWWAISEPKQLSNIAKKIINETELCERFISSISLWEFSMMVKKNRISLKIEPNEWFQHAIGGVGISVIPISENIAIDSCNLPGKFHKDLADRIVVASARINNAILVTKDEKIRNYPNVQTSW